MVKKILIALFLLFSQAANASEFSLAYPASVDPRTYGAKCDGTTDDTAAFLLAFNEPGKDSVFVPPSLYGCALKDIDIPTGRTLFGNSGRYYGGSVPTTAASRIVPAAGAINVINSATQGTIQGIHFYAGGFGESVNWTNAVGAIRGETSRLRLINNTFQFFGNGVLTGSKYNRGLYSYGNIYYGNGQAAGQAALRNLIDSMSIGDTFTSNSTGISFSTGANSNFISTARIEWNTNWGITCYGAGDIDIMNAQYDRNGSGDVKLTNCHKFNDVGGFKRRSGSKNTVGNNASIYSAGGNSDIRFSNTMFNDGVDDGGGGTLSPAYIFYQVADTDTNFYITDNNMVGAYVTDFALYAGTGTGIIVTGNSGVTDKP